MGPQVQFYSVLLLVTTMRTALAQITDVVPRMTAGERELLTELQAAATGVYFAFGCGGSTLMAARQEGIKLVLSVEGNADWIQLLKTHATVRNALHDGRLAFLHVEYNASSSWSFPKDDTMRSSWPSYSRSILYAVDSPLSMVLIDGRFRVACALHALSRIDEHSVVAMHDYSRAEYHVVERFYELVRMVHSLAVFKKRPDVDESEVATLLAIQEFDPK